MPFKGKDSFGSFGRQEDFKPFEIKPITTEFSQGGVPGSITVLNRESAWARWRRGYEIYSSNIYNNPYEFKFIYNIPFPSGTITPSGANPTSIVSGAFKGFPTRTKEFGMHWTGLRRGGNMRTDNLLDSTGTRLSIAGVTEDSSYWYVQLAGTWSSGNPLPSPLFATVSGITTPLKPTNGEILEDRILTVSGEVLTPDSINPDTQRRYGYVQAVLADVIEDTGVLKLKKAGSVEVTPDKQFLTPSTKPPAIGRFLLTGNRYACTCQDFTRREYAFMTTINDTSKTKRRKYFPHSSVASVKPGRHEDTLSDGVYNNNAMVTSLENRSLNVEAPAALFVLPDSIATSAVNRLSTRDNPGIYQDFGATYKRNIEAPSLPGNKPDGLPVYEDYTVSQDVIISLGDYWEPVLDEMRYCKHVYALKFAERVFPPEPSDYPVEYESMAEWEQTLVQEAENNQQKYETFQVTKNSLSYMDVPPYNCQSPTVAPMLQKLFNIPNQIVFLSGFTMIDKTGRTYVPASGEKPSL